MSTNLVCRAKGTMATIDLAQTPTSVTYKLLGWDVKPYVPRATEDIARDYIEWGRSVGEAEYAMDRMAHVLEHPELYEFTGE